jgi:hypothetical protein
MQSYRQPIDAGLVLLPLTRTLDDNAYCTKSKTDAVTTRRMIGFKTPCVRCAERAADVIVSSIEHQTPVHV